MNDTLRNSLVVEVGDLLPQNEIFQQRWAAGTGAQRVLIVGNAHALVSGQRIVFSAFALWLQGIEFFAVGIRRFQAARAVGSAPGAVGFGVGRHSCHPAPASRDPAALPRCRGPVPAGGEGLGAYQTLLVSCFHC
jgi:hypothetical protein